MFWVFSYFNLLKWCIFTFRQNVFIIKTNTNELTSPQGVLKATTVNDNTVGGNIVNIVDNKGKFNEFVYHLNSALNQRIYINMWKEKFYGYNEGIKQFIRTLFSYLGSKTFIGCNNDGQQIQWIKMQENSINVNAVSKQNALISEKIQTGNLNENQNNTSSQVSVKNHNSFILQIIKCNNSCIFLESSTWTLWIIFIEYWNCKKKTT